MEVKGRLLGVGRGLVGARDSNGEWLQTKDNIYINRLKCHRKDLFFCAH